MKNTPPLLLLFAVMMLVVSVQGLSLNFQNAGDASQISCLDYASTGGTCTWAQNITGGNSYFTLANYGGIQSATSSAQTYSAASINKKLPSVIRIRLYDSAMGLLQERDIQGNLATGVFQRVEIKIIGASPHYFIDGVDTFTGAAIVSNPAYILYVGTNDASIDDTIWGDTGSKYIFGMPESGYFLMKDILNPAASGFYRVNQTSPTGAPTLIASTSMTSTFGKGSGTDETVTLFSQSGGTAQSYQTGTAYAGSIYWNLTALFASDMQYGLVQSTIHDQVPNTAPYVVSETIPYIGSGASIQFDKNSYAIGETALLTVVVSDSYYNTATYSYHVVIQDIYGTEVYDSPISFSTSPHTGTASYQWATTDNEGVYYGLIYAKRLSDNVELLMNYDTADLNSNLVINGYVFDAETTNPITTAVVNVTQGTTTDSITTPADGNYTSTSAFRSNQLTTIVASKTGYDTYTRAFTPLYAGSMQINITLMPTVPTHSGIALVGIARSPPYGRTINSATVDIQNTTAPYGSYSVTTNSVGYYIKNSMPNNYLWDIWGSKTGFSNSSIYQKLVTGI
jgi:hypothetical protein